MGSSAPPRGPRLIRRTAALILALGLMSAGCGGSPTPPSPPEGPFTQCPANFQVDSPDGNPTRVTYGLPGASGGTPPLTVTCAPASPTVLPVGTHPITCTVADARGQTASCTFTVRVTAPPRLTHTSFVAFGDSITLGVKSEPVPTFAIVPLPDAYSVHLEQQLRARYRLQSPVVHNQGVGGEKVDGPSVAPSTGVQRLPRALDEHPDGQVLLLMEGTNDLLDFEPGADRAIAGLRRMVQHAKGRGLRVFLATIPPQRAGGRRDRVAQTIPAFNDRIRALASSENVQLVDVYDAMKDRLFLIGIDDLHPTPQGHAVIAQTFFDAIRAHLEAAQPAR